MPTLIRRSSCLAFVAWFLLCAESLPFVPLTSYQSSTLQAQITITPGPKGSSKKAAAEKTGSVSWQVIVLDNKRIGYARNLTQQTTRNGRAIVRTVGNTYLTIKRFGQTLRMETLLETEETPKGEMLTFVLEIRNPPVSTSRTAGRVEGTQLIIESSVGNTKTERSMLWDREVKSPAFQDRWLRTSRMKPGESRTTKVYQPMQNKVVPLTLTADQYQRVKLFDGKNRNLLPVRIEMPDLPRSLAYVDATGEVLRTEVEFLGRTMLTYAVSEEEALKEIAGEELDIAVNTLVAVRPLPRGHGTKMAVYRITTPGRDSAEILPTGPTQTVKRIDPETLELTVIALEVRDGPNDKPVDEQYLSPSRFLQCTDPRVAAHARKAANGSTKPAETALRMESYVLKNLNKKNFSTALASAAEVAKSLEGDCTEHAVLLAAMLRAAKIPSRIAVGLVYVEHLESFGGHMWTEAWLGGKWVPLDATLGRGGIGAAHIKLADSSLANDAPAPVTVFVPLMNVLGRMQIDVMKAE
jgi:hypothetical protein